MWSPVQVFLSQQPHQFRPFSVQSALFTVQFLLSRVQGFQLLFQVKESVPPHFLDPLPLLCLADLFTQTPENLLVGSFFAPRFTRNKVDGLHRQLSLQQRYDARDSVVKMLLVWLRA